MLKEIGTKYVIIGHSERRKYYQESDNSISKKFFILKDQGLVPVLCIGETENENKMGHTKNVCRRQLDTILSVNGADSFNNAIIAYEPIWAIGTGKSATPIQAQEIHSFIRSYIQSFSKEVAQKVIIQYGGSVNPDNAALLFEQPDIDGALVGGCSLNSDDFLKIIRLAACSRRKKIKSGF
jgi:triosephosphate isomerase